MSYQEPDYYAWLIITQQVDVPPLVHAAAVNWWVAMLATNEESL